MRVLVIEDERRLAQIIKRGVVEEGYAADLAFDGEEGKFLAETEDYDLIILDLMLPKIDGLEICRELRSKGVKTAILILTAKTTLDDKVAGLNSGGDENKTHPKRVRHSGTAAGTTGGSGQPNSADRARLGL